MAAINIGLLSGICTGRVERGQILGLSHIDCWKFEKQCTVVLPIMSIGLMAKNARLILHKMLKSTVVRRKDKGHFQNDYLWLRLWLGGF